MLVLWLLLHNNTTVSPHIFGDPDELYWWPRSHTPYNWWPRRIILLNQTWYPI